MSEDQDLCCGGCQAIDVLWPRIELARSLLQHRPLDADTAVLVLRALDGESAGRLCGDVPAAVELREEND